jgi:ABC-type multidrug transport system ATPase subunit
MTASGLVARRGSFVLDVPELELAAGGTAVLGPNGAGKTTLLLSLQGLIPASGTVTLPDRTSAVFAQPAVLRGTVRWNVSTVCRRVLGLDRADADARATNWLEAVGLQDFLAMDARTLSTGQRQRLGIARALALQPEALFLDEPLANVDADGRPALRALLRSYAERTSCVVVMATSSLADACALCMNAVVLRNGRMAHRGPLSALAATEDDYVKALIAEATATCISSNSGRP